MKEYLAELARQASTPAQGRNAAREYLQARILAALQHIQADVRPFVEPGFDLRLLSLENLERVLGE